MLLLHDSLDRLQIRTTSFRALPFPLRPKTIVLELKGEQLRNLHASFLVGRQCPCPYCKEFQSIMDQAESSTPGEYQNDRQDRSYRFISDAHKRYAGNISTSWYYAPSMISLKATYLSTSSQSFW